MGPLLTVFSNPLPTPLLTRPLKLLIFIVISASLDVCNVCEGCGGGALAHDRPLHWRGDCALAATQSLHALLDLPRRVILMSIFKLA